MIVPRNPELRVLAKGLSSNDRVYVCGQTWALQYLGEWEYSEVVYASTQYTFSVCIQYVCGLS